MTLVCKNRKPLASISLDLDNKWSYMKTHGNPEWRKLPSYLDIFIPLILDILDGLGLKITFFIVGQDAVIEENRDVLNELSRKGHEIANHSFYHEPWIHQYPREQIRREILEAEEHIHRVTGQKPTGFRGPGFVWSKDLFEVLTENGYLYDASILPTYIAPLARLYFFGSSNLSADEKVRRNRLFGSVKDALSPVKPYFWVLSSQKALLEIPVTTIPIIKTPFHLSYLIYLSQFSEDLAHMYLRMALLLCRMTETEPSFLLHPLDFLDAEQVPELGFFPGMNIERKRKIELAKLVLKQIEEHFASVKMSVYCSIVNEKRLLPTRNI